jgi:hypothetical protein
VEPRACRLDEERYGLSRPQSRAAILTMEQHRLTESKKNSTTAQDRVTMAQYLSIMEQERLTMKQINYIAAQN